ncbi:MAG: hypothetical protein U1E25_00975 [Methylocystis sp.]
MTYCCGILVREGLVMIADTRTNAGLDNISTFRKLYLFERPGERVLMLAASGNLSVTQGVVNFISEGIKKKKQKNYPQHAACRAVRWARAVRFSRAQTSSAEGEPAAQGVNFDVSLLLGVKSPAVRYVSSTGTSPATASSARRIPIICRSASIKPWADSRPRVTFDTDIYDALKIGLISWI